MHAGLLCWWVGRLGLASLGHGIRAFLDACALASSLAGKEKLHHLDGETFCVGIDPSFGPRQAVCCLSLASGLRPPRCWLRRLEACPQSCSSLRRSVVRVLREDFKLAFIAVWPSKTDRALYTCIGRLRSPTNGEHAQAIQTRPQTLCFVDSGTGNATHVQANRGIHLSSGA